MSTDATIDPVPTRPGTGHWFTGFLALASMGLAVEVLLLTRKNHNLNEELTRVLNPHSLAEVEPGDVFEPLALLGEEGTRVELQFGVGQPKSLLLVFGTGCPDCEKAFPVWNDLVPRPTTPRLRVLGICLYRQTDVEPDASPGVTFPVHTVGAPDKTRIGRVSSVPTTVLLDEYGVVEQAWMGVLNLHQADELRDAIAALTRSVEPTRVAHP